VGYKSWIAGVYWKGGWEASGNLSTGQGFFINSLGTDLKKLYGII
jgi:hypothetical protein